MSLAFGWWRWLALASTCSTCMTLQRKIADQKHFRGLFHNSDRGSNNTAKETTTTTQTAMTNDSSADTESMQPLTRTVCTRTGLAQDVNDNSSSNNNNDDEYHGKNNNNRHIEDNFCRRQTA